MGNEVVIAVMSSGQDYLCRCERGALEDPGVQHVGIAEENAYSANCESRLKNINGSIDFQR